MKVKFLFVVLVLLFISGCGVEEMQEDLDIELDNFVDDAQNEPEDVEEIQIPETGLTGIELKEFTRGEYDSALSEGKTVFLSFYANWCPICIRERPNIVSVLSETNREDLVAFQVNYNDNDTDDDEENLAKQFQVPYQHTKIIINSNEEVLFRTLEVLSKEDLRTKLAEV